MLIQPLVHSPPPSAAFASSVSPTGVEQTVSRAPLPPVDESSRSGVSQNQRNPYPAQGEPSAASVQGADTRRPAAPADESSTDKPQSAASSKDSADSALRQQQEEADQALLAQLKARDREVRLHEAAHAAVGGRYAGAPTYDFRRGPDGQQYAVGGEVSISTSDVPGAPQATLEKARVIRAAALAPAEPSSQDRQVAAEAAQMEINARVELREAEMAERAAAQERRTDHQAERQVDEAARKDQQAAVADVRPPAAEPADPADKATAVGTRDEESADRVNTSDQPNARERLEQLLLSAGSIQQQANRLGLVNPQNPYGKSGFLDVLA